MSLLAESLVEEWLNQNRFFTIRGIKHGNGEIDLLGIRREPGGSITGWHVEVQASVRPIGYIAKSGSGYVKRRTHEEVEKCVRDYVRLKFREKDKALVRGSLWPGMGWSFHLVHGAVKYPEELVVFQHEGVICHSLSQLLEELLHPAERTYPCAAGRDLAEVVGYYSSEKKKTSGP
jgi:hypothetical protein